MTQPEEVVDLKLVNMIIDVASQVYFACSHGLCLCIPVSIVNSLLLYSLVIPLVLYRPLVSDSFFSAFVASSRPCRGPWMSSQVLKQLQLDRNTLLLVQLDIVKQYT